MHTGEECHSRPGWTTRRGQDSPWKSQSEWQRTGINRESTVLCHSVWPTVGSRMAKEQNSIPSPLVTLLNWSVTYYVTKVGCLCLACLHLCCCVYSSVLKVPSVASTVFWTEDEAMWLRRARSWALRCSSSGHTCPSTSPSVSAGLLLPSSLGYCFTHLCGSYPLDACIMLTVAHCLSHPSVVSQWMKRSVSFGIKTFINLSYTVSIFSTIRVFPLDPCAKLWANFASIVTACYQLQIFL